MFINTNFEIFHRPKSKKKRIIKKFRKNKQKYSQPISVKLDGILYIQQSYVDNVNRQVQKSIEEKIIKASQSRIGLK